MSIEDEARAELVVAAERLKKYHGDGFIRSEFRSDMNTVLDSILLVDGAPRKASHKVEVAPSARVVFRGFDTDCGAGFCRSGCSHKMWACSRCSSEGGWGSPVSDLQEMSDAHRCPDPPITAPTKPVPPFKDLREPACVEAWPECVSGGYDPSCCRFPKSCSVRTEEPVQVEVTDEMVEKAARAIFAAMRTSHPLSSMADYDDPAYEYTKNACKRDARAALESALGGGDDVE